MPYKPNKLSIIQGRIITASVVFVSVNELKKIEGGLEIYHIIYTLHNEIKECIEKMKIDGVRVLSALTGAILVISDRINVDLLALLDAIIMQMRRVEIPIKIGAAHGELQELQDVDGTINFIGTPINVAARLTFAKENKGILLHQSLADHMIAEVNKNHWLSSRNRKDIEIRGKRKEKFICYGPPDLNWKSLNEASFAYPNSKPDFLLNGTAISYDLPNFSEGDLVQLSKRFRSVVDTFQELLTYANLSFDGFYLSPGGDGGVFVLSGIEKEQAYDIAKKLASKLRKESTEKDTSISVECRVGVHYGKILLYKNAEGVIRPTGIDVFIADELMADEKARLKGDLVITNELKSAVNDFDEIYEELEPPLEMFGKKIIKYVKCRFKDSLEKNFISVEDKNLFDKFLDDLKLLVSYEPSSKDVTPMFSKLAMQTVIKGGAFSNFVKNGVLKECLKYLETLTIENKYLLLKKVADKGCLSDVNLSSINLIKVVQDIYFGSNE